MKKHTLAFIAAMLASPFVAAQDAVPVNITGEITAAPGAETCSVITTAVDLNFDGTAENWVTHGDHQFAFDTPDQGNEVQIDCTNTTTETTIHFATNAQDSQFDSGCTEGRCTSYPVVFMPPFADCDQSCLDNLTQGQINMYFDGATCGTTTCANQQTGVFNSAFVTVPLGTTDVAAMFSAQLFSNASTQSPFPEALGPISGGPKGPKGTVTPRHDTTPQLYVIYGQ